MRKNHSIIVVYMFALGSFALTAKLFTEGRSYPGTGWAILTSFLIFLIVIERYFRGREDRMEGAEQSNREFLRQRDAGSLEDPESYTEIMTSRNCVEVQFVLDSLQENDIDCIVLDSHTAALMRFLPDVEMRVMVRGKDFERSAEIIADVIAPNASLDDA
jgi:hypothetical protein